MGHSGRSAPARLRRWEGRGALRALGLTEAGGIDLGFGDQHALHHIQEIAAVAGTLVRNAAPGEVRVLVPAYEGGHPDHDAVNAAAALLRQERPDAVVTEFAMYRRGRRGLSVQAPTPAPATPPEPFTALLLDDTALRLRRRLACANTSQLAPSLVPLLALSRAAGRGRREPARALPAHDYGRPPHARPLLYEPTPGAASRRSRLCRRLRCAAEPRSAPARAGTSQTHSAPGTRVRGRSDAGGVRRSGAQAD